MGGFTHQTRRSDQDAGAANERHEPVDFLETELQPGVEECLFVFREDRLGNVKPINQFSFSIRHRRRRPPALRGGSDLPGPNEDWGAVARLSNQPLLAWLRRFWTRCLII